MPLPPKILQYLRRPKLQGQLDIQPAPTTNLPTPFQESPTPVLETPIDRRQFLKGTGRAATILGTPSRLKLLGELVTPIAKSIPLEARLTKIWNKGYADADDPYGALPMHEVMYDFMRRKFGIGILRKGTKKLEELYEKHGGAFDYADDVANDPRQEYNYERYLNINPVGSGKDPLLLDENDPGRLIMKGVEDAFFQDSSDYWTGNLENFNIMRKSLSNSKMPKEDRIAYLESFISDHTYHPEYPKFLGSGKKWADNFIWAKEERDRLSKKGKKGKL